MGFDALVLKRVCLHVNEGSYPLCSGLDLMDLTPFEDAGSDLAQNSLFDCCGTSKMTYEPIFGLVDSRPTPSTNKRRCVVFVTQTIRINSN
jgi:hypothetical protein